MFHFLKLLIIKSAGATSGIGREVALECASRGAKVILGCRCSTRAEAVTAYIRRKTGNADVHYITIDLSSLSSIRDFVDTFYKHHSRVDVLINNAGLFVDYSYVVSRTNISLISTLLFSFSPLSIITFSLVYV